MIPQESVPIDHIATSSPADSGCLETGALYAFYVPQAAPCTSPTAVGAPGAAGAGVQYAGSTLLPAVPIRLPSTY
jgi:hypothetical protein